MTELGKRTADVGVPLVYHHHMNSLGERPQEVAAVLDAADRKYVRVLFDVAHYLQGGGDPVAAVASTLTTSVKVATAPAAKLVAVQATAPVAPTEGVVQAKVGPVF